MYYVKAVFIHCLTEADSPGDSLSALKRGASIYVILVNGVRATQNSSWWKVAAGHEEWVS